MMEQTTLENGRRRLSDRISSLSKPITPVAFEDRDELNEIGFRLDRTKVAIVLGSIAGLLVLANVVILTADYYTGYTSVVIHKLVKLFNLDLESNVPTFFSVLILFTASLLLALITANTRIRKGSHALEWAVLTLGFLFMAFDEMASVHERLIEPMRSLLGVDALGMLYYAWVVPAFALVAFLGVGFLRFLIDLPSKTRWLFMIAASMYLGGALGFELLEGVVGDGTLPYNIFVCVEESLEMGGVIVFIWALLGYLADCSRSGDLRLELSPHSLEAKRSGLVTDLGVQS